MKGDDTMRIVMMACTARGFDAMHRCAGLLGPLMPDAEIIETGHSAYVAGFEHTPPLSELTGEWFGKAEALVYFGAAGIAVRCIAPYIRDKFRDPAVLVIDENARFVISLLSGHAGGANRLCRLFAQALDALPVITTATDGRGIFSVDTYAAENGLALSDRTLAKEISARLLAGETVKLYADEANGKLNGCRFPVPVSAKLNGKLNGCRFYVPISAYGQGATESGERSGADIILSVRREPGDPENALYLIPRTVTLGIGCRRGTSSAAIAKAAQELLQRSGVFREALSGIASIDLKRDEEGLTAFAKEWDLPLSFFTADELASARGQFSSSAFVREVTGVDNVCERSAVLLAGENGKILAGKESRGGVTAALGIRG